MKHMKQLRSMDGKHRAHDYQHDQLWTGGKRMLFSWMRKMSELKLNDMRGKNCQMHVAHISFG